MQSNLLFFLAASNAILKPGGPLKWKKGLMKNVRHSLPLIEAIKIAKLISPLLDEQSASVFAGYLRPHFSVSVPLALPGRARGFISELRRVTCPEESHSSFCSSSSPAE